MKPFNHLIRRQQQSGFSLIELMVAMLVGVIVAGAAIGVFITGQHTYRSTHALNDIQTNARMAFEMLARDIRQAGINGCGSQDSLLTLVKHIDSAPWSDWHGDISAQDGQLRIMGIGGSGWSIDRQDDSDRTIRIYDDGDMSSLKAGDALVGCDVQVTTAFQVAKSGSSKIEYANHITYNFDDNAMLFEVLAHTWDVHDNGLYQTVTNFNGTGSRQEMLRGVHAMNLTYHVAGDDRYVDADKINDDNHWAKVDAVKVELEIESLEDRTGTNGKPLRRTFSNIIALRGRTGGT